jgi:hypothetical protein
LREGLVDALQHLYAQVEAVRPQPLQECGLQSQLLLQRDKSWLAMAPVHDGILKVADQVRVVLVVRFFIPFGATG